MEEIKIEVSTAALKKLLDRKNDLEDIIIQLRDVVNSGESYDFIVSRINTILFEWRK